MNGSGKTGSGGPTIGHNPTVGPLDRVRVDSTGRGITTNQGVPVADNQNSLKAGLRGPTLLEDFILREKITHFDHERSPERIVHARGSAAHGYFECSTALQEYTRASLFAEVGKQTPVFVRFSTVLGERGSTDTASVVNAQGESHLVKFHWTPRAGTHSLVWDEAVKISGADPDFHRRDLWEAIEAGAYPEYELGLQIFTEEQAEAFTFDVLDATKLVPEELVPVTPVGRLVLNRNPDNFFAETEQVAFCAAHVVPGIDFSNDPLLAGRIHSYIDTQISRLGGPNFHEIPINAPIAQVHNNQRDGMHRQAIHRGRVSYEPNSLAGGCPFQAGTAGVVSFPEPREAVDHKVRGKPERFADHYTQATLFWNSQTDVEKQHIISAFRFELTRVQTPAVRERMVSGLMNVDAALAKAVATGLGIREMPSPMPKVMTRSITPEVVASPALSSFARTGDGSIRATRIAILVADRCEGAPLIALANRLTAEGAVPRFVSTSLGAVEPTSGDAIEVDASLEATPSVLYDAMVLPDGADAVRRLQGDGRTLEFIKDQYRHCKPLLAFGKGAQLLVACGIEADQSDTGLMTTPQVDVLDALRALTGGQGPDACIDAVGLEAHGTTLDAWYDRAKTSLMLATDRPHALRHAISACRKGGTVSIPGVYGGWLDKFPLGAAFAKGLTLKMGQTHMHTYLPGLLARIERGEIDPSFIVTHRMDLDDAPGMYRTFQDKEDQCIKVVMRPSDAPSTHRDR